MAVGLRPQSPPTITLGKNTFTTDGMGNRRSTMPLLDIQFTGDGDRLLRRGRRPVHPRVHGRRRRPPAGRPAGRGDGQARRRCIGNPTDAFTNISVKNTDAVTETPADLANLFPAPAVAPAARGTTSLLAPSRARGLPHGYSETLTQEPLVPRLGGWLDRGSAGSGCTVGSARSTASPARATNIASGAAPTTTPGPASRLPEGPADVR